MPAITGWTRELTLFDNLLDLDRAGASARLLQLTGEASIGKTRLLAEFCAGARRRGWTVAAGRAERTTEPFGGVADAVDACLRRAPQTLWDQLAAAELSALAAVLPAAATRLTTTRPAACGTAQAQPYGALRVLLGHLARPRGLLLALDDAHLAGPETMALLRHLVRRPPDGPVLVVTVVRRSAQACQVADELRQAAAGASFQAWELRAPAAELPAVGEVVCDPEPEGGEEPELEALSKRETQVARFVSMGCTNQQIASRLGLSQKTVETYMARIFKKLAVCSRTQVAYCLGRLDALADSRPLAG
ncbi:helix-turn-helix transcriptional regulator [Streptantibioticus cattleyicolor]|uniref:Multidomain-containing protein family n=1 Tax=Streptantibioticus cattleyicolor (strain ATCC 35852 / DSM 46488 / JCM 4925 / NBRC 14057 / NRRL 8057) TaxID=1003195 RepID=F8JMK7_STREN|nr:AAA family ATPase [Streptantibioticus cattleyicolor]AEW99309.1 multidomain-containing protein family [Streptantibioticus cattleyicolor NRRL 8057 = DSM 46488]CCB71652.1 protein of unknown function [Streptantibioticus cattleyicolor NRRL 8057 = DSM 46488]